MSRPKSKRKLRRLTLARARKRYEERKKVRIAELKELKKNPPAVSASAPATGSVASPAPKRATVTKKPSA